MRQSTCAIYSILFVVPHSGRTCVIRDISHRLCRVYKTAARGRRSSWNGEFDFLRLTEQQWTPYQCRHFDIILSTDRVILEIAFRILSRLMYMPQIQYQKFPRQSKRSHTVSAMVCVYDKPFETSLHHLMSKKRIRWVQLPSAVSLWAYSLPFCFSSSCWFCAIIRGVVLTVQKAIVTICAQGLSGIHPR